MRHILQHKIDQAARFICISLASMPKKELKSLVAYINDFVLGDERENFPSWFKMTLDMIETKIYKLPPKPEKKLPKYRISIPFVNKAMDFINLPQIIRSKNMQRKICHLY